MATLNLTKIGSLVKVEYTGGADRYVSSTNGALSFIAPADGAANVEIDLAGVHYSLAAITDIQIAGVAVTNQSDFETKIATVFPNANSGSGGSGVTLSQVDAEIAAQIPSLAGRISLSGTSWNVATQPEIEKVLSANTALTLSGGVAGKSMAFAVIKGAGFTLSMNGTSIPFTSDSLYTAIQIVCLLDGSYLVISDTTRVAVPASAPAASDTDALNYISRVATAGYSMTSSEQTAVDTYVTGLKSAGLWTRIYDECLSIGGSVAAAHLVTLKGVVTQSAVSSPSFAANGVTTNGSSQYINTGLIPSTACTLNSASIWLYSRTAAAVGGGYDLGGQNGGAQEFAMILRRSDNSRYAMAYSESNGFGMLNDTGATDGSGCFVVSRTASNAMFYMRNGTVQLSSTNSLGGTLPTVAVFLGTLNTGSGTFGFTARQYCAWGMGGAHSTTEAQTKTTLLNALQTSLSRNTF